MDLPRGYISYNQIRVYQSCPYKYYLTYIKELCAPVSGRILTGTVFHAVAEALLLAKINSKNLSQDEFHALFHETFEKQRQERELELDEGIGKIRNKCLGFARYFFNNSLQEYAPLMVERSVEGYIEQSGIKMRGVIDMVEEDYSITDFKTSSAKWNSRRLRYSMLQMVLYRYMLDQELGEVSGDLKFRIFHSRKGNSFRYQEAVFNRECFTTNQMVNIVEEVALAIGKGDFEKKPSFFCTFCEFKDKCQRDTCSL